MSRSTPVGLAGASPQNARAARAAFEERVKAMLEQVRARGLKLTPQRMAIVRELAADPTHPTAQELFERLKPSLPTMSFATVYNTLDALASAGLCAALSLSPGAARFDPNMQAHHHAVCDRCGLVRDVPATPASGSSSNEAPHPASPADEPAPTDASAAAAGVSSVPGFTVRAVEKIFRGLCAECARAAEGSARPASRALAPQAESAGKRARPRRDAIKGA